MTDRPISDAVRQGWVIVSYSVCDMGGSAYCHSVLLAKDGQHKTLTIRKKMIGDGVVVDELEV